MVSSNNLVAIAVLLAAGANAQCTVSSDVSALISTIQKLNTDTIAADTAVKAFVSSQSATNALDIQEKEQDIGADVSQAISQAQNLPSANTCDSQAIFQALVATGPSIVQLLEDLIDQKALFDEDGLTSTVQGDLATLQQGTVALETAAYAKLDCSVIPNTVAAFNIINQAFDSALTTYGATGATAPTAPVRCASSSSAVLPSAAASNTAASNAAASSGASSASSSAAASSMASSAASSSASNAASSVASSAASSTASAANSTTTDSGAASATPSSTASSDASSTGSGSGSSSASDPAVVPVVTSTMTVYTACGCAAPTSAVPVVSAAPVATGSNNSSNITVASPTLGESNGAMGQRAVMGGVIAAVLGVATILL
jgi:hypothetical protein